MKKRRFNGLRNVGRAGALVVLVVPYPYALRC